VAAELVKTGLSWADERGPRDCVGSRRRAFAFLVDQPE
jgi:hypothetical protein